MCFIYIFRKKIKSHGNEELLKAHYLNSQRVDLCICSTVHWPIDVVMKDVQQSVVVVFVRPLEI